MTEEQKQELGNKLWALADEFRGGMDADDFRDYMLSFLFLRYISDRYSEQAQKEFNAGDIKLKDWYAQNPTETQEFEEVMRTKMHYVIQPDYLWDNIAELARTQSKDLLRTTQEGFKYIETKSFRENFKGLFSEINLDSEKLGKNYAARNEKLCKIISKIAQGIDDLHRLDSDVLGDAYEYLIGQFAAGSGKKAGEFYTPQQISNILAEIVVLDGQNPAAGQNTEIKKVMDFACGSGSLLLSVRKHLKNTPGAKIFGQESNITTFNLARMNMLLHGVNDTLFEINHGDSLNNDWEILSDPNPAHKMKFDAVVANPPFSYKWDHTEQLAHDPRFKDYGLAPRSAADFAFLLHGFHYLGEQGTMAIILPHGVLFRGGVERDIRQKLLTEDRIDTVIGLPPNLFYSTGIPVCIVVLKKCKKTDDVLFINAAPEFTKGKRQNRLEDSHVSKIVACYKNRSEIERYARRVTKSEIEKNDWSLNISRYINANQAEQKIDLAEVQRKLTEIEAKITASKNQHNRFLQELGLSPI
ncbi:MAG: type I restriction-modification system subunit M [Candidatus Symbiobacter sp.]|nr:type I restriction-modification system subunit M [Candidatus Symbiobacter sp.]